VFGDCIGWNPVSRVLSEIVCCVNFIEWSGIRTVVVVNKDPRSANSVAVQVIDLEIVHRVEEGIKPVALDLRDSAIEQ
jgi:hypothetical protein